MIDFPFSLEQMSDCEETDFFWEPWTFPGKRKRKKDSKRDKRKNNITMKTDENIQKKKKKSKFKEAMEGRKEKKKEKKKKKNRLALEPDGRAAQAKPTVTPGTRSDDELKPDHLTQDSKKKNKRKKKVAFDITPGYICVKRPKLVSSSQRFPKESILSDNEAVSNREGCSWVTVTGRSRGQARDDSSQCTSDDINSQDLFITQKTFRASPSEPSSGEASDKAATATPSHGEGSRKCPRDSPFHQHHKKASKHVQKPETVPMLLTEEEEGSNKAHQNPEKGKLSSQTQMEFNTTLTEEKTVSCPVHGKPRGMNLYQDEPSVVNPSPVVSKSKKHSCTSCLQHTCEPSAPPPVSTTNTSTQTENFFTTELSSYLNFFQIRRASSHFEDLKPLDLSLKRRARKDPGASSLPGEAKSDGPIPPDLCPRCPSDVKAVEARREPSGRHPWFVSTQGKGETAPSPSESELKTADTTTSSEDNEPPCRTGKLDLTQVTPHDTTPIVHCSYTGPCSRQISFVFSVLHSLQFHHLFFSEQKRYLNSMHIKIAVPYLSLSDSFYKKISDLKSMWNDEQNCRKSNQYFITTLKG